MISVSPISGYKFITPFTVHISPSAENVVINWGDNTFSSTSTATHVYSAQDVYRVFAGNCNATSAFTLSVFRGGFFDNKITVAAASGAVVASCRNTFTLQISSTTPTATIYLYSSGSNAYPHNTDRNFWSHLNPEWKFTDSDGIAISEFPITGTPVYDINLNVLGYSALSSVGYTDDMPGSPILFFTMIVDECDVPINSRVYAALNYSVLPDIPQKLVITADGINSINGIQWAGTDIPYLVSVQGQNGCKTIMHYASGYLTKMISSQLCHGVSISSYGFPISSINLLDEDCFSVGGYLRTNFNLPASAIPANILTNDMNEFACVTKNPDEIKFTPVRYAPYTQLYATALISVSGRDYTLSGISDPFYVYRLENFHQFYRKGEHKTPYDFIKQYSHIDLTTVPVFDSYLSAVAGSGDSLGKVYDSIFNIPKDIGDIDLCHINSLYNTAKKMDVDIDDFDLSYPEELKRLMNFFSIPLQKLVGTRCVCNTQFSCQGCCGKNVCTICGFDKKSNLGEQISMTNYVTAGQTILIKEGGSEIYDFLPITRTCLVRDITASPVYENGIANYCFFKWDDFHQSNPVEGQIDYLNPRTTLSKELSSADQWYRDNGIVEEMINYTLTKNLLD